MSLLGDLLAAWEMQDAAGTTRPGVNGNHVGVFSLSDIATVGQTTGHVSAYAGSFAAASTQYLRSSDSDLMAPFTNQDLTVEAWFKLTDLSGTYAIHEGFLAPGGTTDALIFDTSDSLLVYNWSDVTDGAKTLKATTFGALSAATWYQVFAKYVASAKTGYIRINNGAWDSLAGTGGKYTTPTSVKFSIGYRWGSVTYPMNGVIGPFRIWTRALSDAECTSLWNGGAGLAFPFGLQEFIGGGTRMKPV